MRTWSSSVYGWLAVLAMVSAGCGEKRSRGESRDGGVDAEAEAGESYDLSEASPWTACGPREWQVAGETDGGVACECQPRFAGEDCEACAPGYSGEHCTECEAGYVRSDRHGGGFDPNPDAPTEKSWAAMAWEFRCDPAPTRDCDDLDCGSNGTCVPGDGFATCACDPGSTGERCDACAPLHERDGSGDCVLGDACRTAVCGGLGDCALNDAGSVECACDDAGETDPRCGATADPVLLDNDGNELPWRSAYPGETLILRMPLDDTGGQIDARVLSGPGALGRCVAPACPEEGNAILEVDDAPLTGITFITVEIGESAQPYKPTYDIAVIPTSYVPITGTVHPELKPLYENVLWFLKARGIRAAALGLSKGGVALAKNGFGYRDSGIDNDPWRHEGENGPPVTPGTPFRLASLSKPITAAAVRRAAAMRGVQLNSAAMGQRAADVAAVSLGTNLASSPPMFAYSTNPGINDPRWANVTIQHLLNHNAGFFRDVAHPSTQGQPILSGTALPNTLDPQGNPQTDLTFGNGGFDLFFSTALYATAALGPGNSPAVDARRMARLIAGISLDYTPGQGMLANDNYSNYGYALLGRVLEGLSNRTYNPTTPDTPFGWGAVAELTQEFMCTVGVTSASFFPGDGRPQNGEPAYRALDALGQEVIGSWDIADPARMRFRPNGNAGFFEFCTREDAADCDPTETEGWTRNGSAPAAYGGIPMGPLGAAGGWVGSVDAYLRFARLYRTSVGRPGEGATGTGSLLAGVAAHIAGSSHNGALPGTWNWVWQLAGGNSTITMPERSAVWDEDLPASAPSDQGGVLVNESLLPAAQCAMPDDVAIVLLLNQRDDYRAPLGGVSPMSNSSNAAVYGRVRDFVLDGVCQVDEWPTPSPGDVFGVAPQCL